MCTTIYIPLTNVPIINHFDLLKKDLFILLKKELDPLKENEITSGIICMRSNLYG